ncbi:MAG: AmmeMemoRadiSam system protein B [Mariprofundus sp.]|nr:AmmeMemoRadiSam system protein B [Mariprofundus sp.]
MSVRPAAVAGLFYPGEARELAAFVAAFLHDATARLPAALPVPEAVIVPHAGYIYSGPTAGFAYAAAALKGAMISRVVLLGPAHRLAFYGMALSGYDAFATPLGDVRLDTGAIQQLLTLPGVHVNDAAHAQEHSLEVQLPFLQTVLGDFSLVPVCIGSVPPDAVARVIESLWGDKNTLFVISSDLSHYHSYDEARALDRLSIDTILAMRDELNHEQACGATGINALLSVSGRHGLTAKLLDYRNSGDTAGDRDRVVGYASIAFYGQEKSS